ncbi:hypothetical protein [Mesorhizobium sp. M7A.F.Ca.MR.362.00.0.0]|uniref:hypothetical protein n=1 Tax=Mesorhizobium sp. M7A.F.Ca.MR.362.00.0.0 TaxID=2496779 RepID=UPI000FD33607|nr:hypothetical protein [Mesorhizobium sp. M7A.F.Ca.MR.362.00.0.0]RUU79991.1 hypothetical protein EOC06_13850 [Mesorhizobium sp. M7A.F.Ca.MR.362.00.0.0]
MILNVPVLHVADMQNGQREDNWRETESVSDAVRRLCRAIDERKERRLAGGQNGPAEIQDPRQYVPASREKGADDEKSALGSGTLDPRRQQSTVANGEECRGSGLGGRAGFTVGLDYVSEKISPKETARPTLDASLTGVDRAVTRSRGCK